MECVWNSRGRACISSVRSLTSFTTYFSCIIDILSLNHAPHKTSHSQEGSMRPRVISKTMVAYYRCCDEVGAVVPELKWEPYHLEVYGLNSDPQSRHWVRIEQVSLSRAYAVFILPSLSCALRKFSQPIPSVDIQSHHVFSFVLRRSFFYLAKTVSVPHFTISASRSFALMALLTSSLWQGGPDLPPPLRWLAALIIIIFCSSNTVTLLSWLLLLSLNFYPWLDVAQKLCHLLYARLPSFYKFPFPPKHVKVFSIPDTPVFSGAFAHSSFVHVYSLTAWRLTSGLDWTVTDQHTHYTCVCVSDFLVVCLFSRFHTVVEFSSPSYL